MSKRTYIVTIRLLSYTAATFVVAYIAFANTTPFDVELHFASADKTVSTLTPPNRIEATTTQGAEVTKQKDDLIYFTTKLPTTYEKARVKITFINGSPDQELEVGFKDKSQWHYATQVVDNPLFHRTDLTYIGTSTVLYAPPGSGYQSAQQFLSNPPSGVTTGTLDYSIKDPEPVSLPDYEPAKTDTSITTPLRGSHTFYAYLENEPFRMSITKKDLNWYSDPDAMEVRVYKDDDLVYTVTYDDDGITDDSRKVGPQEIGAIENPGPGLPESGVYKIVIDANSDTLVTNITTNLHKIVFAGPLYPVHNAESYPEFVHETSTTTLYTNSSDMSVITHHGSAMQTLVFEGRKIPIASADSSTLISSSSSVPAISISQPDVVVSDGNATTSLVGAGASLTPAASLLSDAKGLSDVRQPDKTTTPISSSTSLAQITLPKSDVILTGSGYFAFSKDAFFLPGAFIVVPIKAPEDINMVDYVVSPYEPPKKVNGFLSVEREFDILSAVPKDGRLSWIIRAPGLKDKGNEVLIKDIEVTYSKKGWTEK
jgi:hypothetical protein